MENEKLKTLPLDYKIDKDLLRLVGEANEKYGEYKILLNNCKFDSKFFLDSIILNESIKSTEIEGSQISQDEMYYLKYLKNNDDKKEIENLKNVLLHYEDLFKKNKKLNLKMCNEIHKELLDSSRGSNKNPGCIRTVQNLIGPRGCSIKEATYIPPSPEELDELLDNLFEYMNDKYIDPIFINVALSHLQFESIHAYRDGNGRLGRTLIPLQTSILTGDKVILFLSETIQIYKPTYYKLLNEARYGNVLGYLKFFMQCIIEQCNCYIVKLKRIEEIYNDDLDLISEYGSNAIYKIMPAILHQIIFTKTDLEGESKVSRQTVDTMINKLLESKIIEEDDTKTKKGFKYKKIYDVFVGKENY